MSLPGLRAQGKYLVEAGTGRRFTYVGIDAFALFKRWLMPSGPTHLVAPWLENVRQIATEGGYLGPIVLRVFRHAAPWNAFHLVPDYPPAALRPFVEFCGDRGFYVDLTAGDAQLYFANQSAIQQHVNECCAAVVDLPNIIFATCNEPFKNGIDVSIVRPPQWGTVHPLLRDSGAYGEAGHWPTHCDLDLIDYHPRRHDAGRPYPLWLTEVFDSAFNLMNLRDKPVRIAEPIGCAEVAKPGSRHNDPVLAELMGGAAAFCGITLHIDFGMSCDAPGQIQRQCAVSYFRGAAGAVGARGIAGGLQI